MMITPLGVGGGSHVSVMVVKVLLKACSPLTGPGASVERNNSPLQYPSISHLPLCSVTTKRGEV